MSPSGPTAELDLWHPTGAPRRRLVLGDGEEALADGEIDLALIRPGRDQLGSSWLERAVAAAAERLAPSGVLWVIVPRGGRRRAERAVGQAGLVLRDAVLLVPAWPRTAHLIPLAPATLSDAGPRHLGVPTVGARLAGVLSGTRLGRTALSTAASGCALLATRDGATPLLRWIDALAGGSTATATVSSGPRRSDGRVAVLLRFLQGAHRPDLAVKVALDDDGAERLGRERSALEALSGEATRAGAMLPVRVASSATVLVSDVLPGRPASGRLARSPRRLDRVVTALSAWLAAWNRRTASTAPASQACLDELLLGAAKHAAAAGAVSKAYLDFLRLLARRFVGGTLTTVATHNDLTMANVLDGGPGLGVLDWEAASAEGLPLTDLWYSLVDALARAHGITHAEALTSVAQRRPPARATLWQPPTDHVVALSLTSDQALLGFHSCWLAHAADELRRDATDRPFLAVVRAIDNGRLFWT